MISPFADACLFPQDIDPTGKVLHEYPWDHSIEFIVASGGIETIAATKSDIPVNSFH